MIVAKTWLRSFGSLSISIVYSLSLYILYTGCGFVITVGCGRQDGRGAGESHPAEGRE